MLADCKENGGELGRVLVEERWTGRKVKKRKGMQEEVKWEKRSRQERWWKMKARKR